MERQLMKNCVLFLALSFVSFTSWAMTPMEQHIQFVSQGMSAFYMYSLSNSDEKYLRQFKQYQHSAASALRKVSPAERKSIPTDWQALKIKLQYRPQNGGGLYFDGVSRTEYRNYLTALYLHYKQTSNSTKTDLDSALTRIQLLSSLLAARALDVVSADYGAMGLTEHDIKISPVEVAQQITVDLELLLGKNLPKKQQHLLRKVDSKFRFIKNTLVNYKTETAYFLIYRNVKSINKLLDKKSFPLTANNLK
jgi:hypothetical protein